MRIWTVPTAKVPREHSKKKTCLGLADWFARMWIEVDAD